MLTGAIESETARLRNAYWPGGASTSKSVEDIEQIISLPRRGGIKHA
jgi:hypothetical protein